MPLIKQSSAGTPLTFFLVLASDHLTGAPGLTPTVTISKNGGAYASPAGTVSDNGNGWYAIAGNATDCNTLGPIDIHATAATADPCDMKDVAQIVAFDPSSSSNLGLTNLDATISSRMATFTIPTNFSSLSIDGSGRVDLGKWIGVAPNALISGRVDSNVGVNNDKTGYSLSQAFPTNFSSLSIDASGRVDLGKWLGSVITPSINGTLVVSTGGHSGTAQAGGANTITLAASASATDSFYISMKVAIIGGTGAGQAQFITGYVGSTKVATVRSAWVTNPDNTSIYAIQAGVPLNITDGLPRVDVEDWAGSAVATPSISGIPKVDVNDWRGSIPNNLVSGRVDVNVGINSDKTGYTLSSAGIQAIFDFATSLLTTVGSIGKLLVTNLDTNVASRSTLDQAAIRTATGLASANLDTQFTAIPDAILDKANGVESGWTLRQLFRLWLAGICGPRASFGTAAPTVQNPGSTKTRLTGAGIDVNGNGTWSTDVT